MKIQQVSPSGKVMKELELDLPEDAHDARVLGAIIKHKRQEKFKAFGDMKDEFLALGLVEHTEYHFGFTLDGVKGNYWPSGGKWQYGKMYHGTPQDFMNWLKRRLKK